MDAYEERLCRRYLHSDLPWRASRLEIQDDVAWCQVTGAYVGHGDRCEGSVIRPSVQVWCHWLRIRVSGKLKEL